MMTPKEIEAKHQELVRFIEKKLDAARAYERELRYKRSLGENDELGRLIGEEYLRTVGQFYAPFDRVITDAVERVKSWERVLDDCSRYPNLTPESVLSIPPPPQSGFQTLYSACWGALGERTVEEGEC